MEWLDRLNGSIDYVETHLDGEVTVEGAARIAACSVFHYQRMFAYIAGVTFTEYVRRRRMSAAALELAGGAKVVDVALRYGYDSPTAFNRAFRSVHGVPPSAAKISGIGLTDFPRITFTLSIKGEKAMNYRIEQRDTFRVVGCASKETMSMEDGMKEVPLFWHKTVEEGMIPRLCALCDGSEPQGLLGISDCGEGGFFRYYIAAATTGPVPEGMTEFMIPKGTWAIFECVGAMPRAIQDLQQRVLSEWLPASGYEYASAPDIEVYSDGDQSAENYRSQVWLPIVKKKTPACPGGEA